jgi:all-trans-retinol 13,14-reductase
MSSVTTDSPGADGGAPKRADAIVVGSGLGGLSCAAYLAACGLHTIVLEQGKVAGGCSQVFRRQGNRFEFDVGVHYIGECDPGGRMTLVLSGLGLEQRVTFRELDPDGYATIVLPGLTFRVPRGWDAYLARLLEAFPDEERGLRRCVRVMRYVAERMPAGPLPTRATQAAVAFRSLPAIPLGLMPVRRLFDICGLSPRARAVLLGESGDYGTPPSRAPVAVHAGVLNHYLRGGAYYPRGGGQVIAANLVEVIGALGGQVRTKARVEQILVEHGAAVGVRLAGGEELRAPVVVSNADYRRTLLDLVGRAHLRERTVRKVERSRMALPFFSVYLGLDIDLSDRLANSTFWIYPSDDVEGHYQAAYDGRVPEGPPVFLTSATTKDPDNARAWPAGHSTLELMCLAPPDHAFWAVDGDPASEGPGHAPEPAYRDRKEMLIEQLIDRAAGVVPDLREHIVWREASTPVTQERFTLSTGGACYGLELAGDQVGPKRPGVRSEIRGLYLTGASTVWGHGIVGVMLGGVGTAGAVLKRDLTSEILQGRRIAAPLLDQPVPDDWDPLLVCRTSSPVRHRQPDATST